MEEMEETRSFESEDSMDCDSFTPPIIGNKLPWQKNRIIDFENAAMPGVFEDDRVLRDQMQVAYLDWKISRKFWKAWLIMSLRLVNHKTTF